MQVSLPINVFRRRALDSAVLELKMLVSDPTKVKLVKDGGARDIPNAFSLTSELLMLTRRERQTH